MLSDISTEDLHTLRLSLIGRLYTPGCSDAANLESELDLIELEINRRMDMEAHDRLRSNIQALLGQIFQK